jgi:hypothetical protein
LLLLLLLLLSGLLLPAGLAGCCRCFLHPAHDAACIATQR